MREPDEFPPEEFQEGTKEKLSESVDDASATPLPDTQCQPTESHHPDATLESFEESFDTANLLKSSHPNSIGRLGKYHVIEMIGQGGMGVVLRAFDESLGRHVAIKVLSRQLASSSTAKRRFLREARAVAAISHPNVITIHAVESHDGQPFLVMEFADGGSLHERIRKQAPLPFAEVLRLGSQIASGLAAAHDQGVIHRDIKPGNVMLENEVDRVKITDFGLARMTMDNSDLTSQGHRLGTPSYMSPEQVNGSEVDDRSDLFSLGCVLYAMIAGKSRFRGKHAFDAARKILEETPVPLHELDSSVPPFFSEIVSRLLEKDPKKRYQTAAEVAEVLSYYVAKLNQTRTDQLHSFSQQSLSDLPSKRPSGWMLASAGLIVAVIAVAAFSLPHWFRSGQPTATTNLPDPMEAATSPPDPDSDDAVKQLDDLFVASFRSDGQDAGVGAATPGIGNKDAADYYITHPKNWPLVGFKLTTYEFKGSTIVKTMQPLFRDADGKTESGEMVGRLNPNCQFHHVIADPGYAVSGIEAVGGRRVYALKVIFRRIDDSQESDAEEETYESAWFGGSDHKSAQLVGGKEALAIGMVCSFNVDMHQIGLVLADAVPSE